MDTPPLAPVDTIFERDSGREVDLAVCVIAHNYGHYIEETLASIDCQTLADIEVLVVDDASTDDTVERARQWLETSAHRFSATRLLRMTRNCGGPSIPRNVASAQSRSEFLFFLDADNLLYPRCLERLREALANNPEAAAVYPILEKFGDESGLLGTDPWHVDYLKSGPYIDTMALVRRAAWEQVGGFSEMMTYGWEDYDFWLKLAEAGLTAMAIPEILGRYRVHGSSLLRSGDARARAQRLRDEVFARHPWIEATV
jgi:GT2 family glycosyltransferase